MEISVTNFFNGQPSRVHEKEFTDCKDLFDVIMCNLANYGVNQYRNYTHSFVYYKGEYNSKLSNKLTKYTRKYIKT